MRIVLDLTIAEAAVLSHLVHGADPEWGDPLKDIEDGTNDRAFKQQKPYPALKTLQAKLRAAGQE